jgi:cytochrome P450
LLNLRGINHDPARHPDPDAFKPERYIGDDTNAAESAALPDATKRGLHKVNG